MEVKYLDFYDATIYFCSFRGDTVWDVTLKSADGKELHAHKCVLASQSEYFERMFIGGFRETTQDVIQINDISGDVLNNIIDFMYTGVLVKIEQDNVEVMIYLFSSSNVFYSTIIHRKICS